MVYKYYVNNNIIVYIHVCDYVYTCTYIPIHTHTHTYTVIHIHPYTHIFSFSCCNVIVIRLASVMCN